MSKRVLIIDDDPGIRRMIRVNLECIGHEVFDAPDGAVGMAEFKRRNYDLIICDINMPNKDGLEMIRQLRASKQSVSILAISGNTSQYGFNYLPSAIDFGANWTLEKPFNGAEIIGAVQSILIPEDLVKSDKVVGKPPG